MSVRMVTFQPATNSGYFLSEATTANISRSLEYHPCSAVGKVPASQVRESPVRSLVTNAPLTTREASVTGILVYVDKSCF